MSTKDIIALVDSQSAQIKAALPRGHNVARIKRLIRTTLSTNEILHKCSPRSILGAAIEAAQLGLEPGITCHIVPYWNNKNKGYLAQMIPEYRGLMDMARRTGMISSIWADVVRAGDHIEYRRGTSPMLEHRPVLGSDAEIVGAYAVARYTGSEETQFEIVSKREIDALRDQALGKIRNEAARKYSPWSTSYDAMAKKTAVRRLCKFLPSSVESADLQRAVILDEAADRGEQHLGVTLEGDFSVQEFDREIMDADARAELSEKIAKGASEDV